MSDFDVIRAQADWLDEWNDELGYNEELARTVHRIRAALAAAERIVAQLREALEEIAAKEIETFGSRLPNSWSAIARAALAAVDREEPCEFCGDGPCPHGCEEVSEPGQATIPEESGLRPGSLTSPPAVDREESKT